MPQNLFSEKEEEQEQFTRNYLTPKERERLERDLYDMGLLPQAYFAWAEEDKTAALRQLYDQGGINFYLEKLAADSQRDQLDGNLLNSVVKLLCDFSDTNENYWQKLQQGNILGSILNLMGATLRAPKTLVLNLSSMINSLLTWSEFTWQHDMTYREYLVQSGQKYGVRTLIDDLDKLRQTGALGKIAADTIETVFEMASDPLILIGMLNQFGVQPPGTQQYIEKLQRGGFVGQNADGFSDSAEGVGEIKIPHASELKNSRTVQNKMNDFVKKGRYKGEVARPYIDSNGTISLLDEIMNGGIPAKDSFLQNGLRWDVSGNFRGSEGVWELVVDLDTNTIVHFNFVVN